MGKSYILGYQLSLIADIDENTKLASKSWLFFTILKISADWLVLSPAQWKENQDYIEAEQFVKSVKVSNDVVERGV